ncbi:unnamed protein product, partial [Closterium sp. NIES-53]
GPPALPQRARPLACAHTCEEHAVTPPLSPPPVSYPPRSFPFPSLPPFPTGGGCRTQCGTASQKPTPSSATCSLSRRTTCSSPTRSLHHWWWMQNTVWDGLSETNTFTGHMLFIEEDHLLFPNALAHLKSLIRVKNVRCPECVAVTLAPSNVKSRGESGLRAFVRERMGNVGYAFNRSVWKQIHKSHKYFCYFDDYNWDVSLSESIFHYWRQSSSLRWSAASAHHFGRCGLHSEKPEAPAHYLVRKNKTKSELGEEHVLDADARVNPRGRLDSH